MDPTRNKGVAILSAGVDASATGLDLLPGYGARLPDPATEGAFQLMVWNGSDFANPLDDPYSEIFRCTAKSTDHLSIVRPSEANNWLGEGSDNIAQNHHLAGKTYKVALAITRRMLEDIAAHTHDADYAPIAAGVSGGDNHDHSGGDGGQIAYGSLSGLPSLGNAASKNVGTTAGTVAAGDDARFHSQGTDTGTTSNTFQVGAGGPRIKNNAGVLEARNATDDAYVGMAIDNIHLTGTAAPRLVFGPTVANQTDQGGVFFRESTSHPLPGTAGSYGIYQRYDGNLNALVFDTVVNNVSTHTFSITRDGKTGFNTASPEAIAEMFGSTTGSMLLLSANDGSGSSSFGMGFYVKDRQHQIAQIAAQYDSSSDGGYGNLILRTRSAGVLYDRVFLKWDGKIGFGMVPTVGFELAGSVGQKASGTTWSNPSDSRLKEILGPADLQRCYDDIKTLAPELLRYRLKNACFSAAQASDRTVTGFTADAVERVMPKAVSAQPFAMVAVEDGIEEYSEQDSVVETIEEERIEVIDGQPTLVVKPVERKKLLFDDMPVVDAQGQPVMVWVVISPEIKNEDGTITPEVKELQPLMHPVPRMVVRTRPKYRQDTITDCKNLDMSQVYMQALGALMRTMQMVEAQAAEITELKAAVAMLKG